MKAFLRFFAVALAMMILALRPAAAEAPDLAGWWHGALEHRGDRADFYLHLQGGERPRATFSVPQARIHEGAMGPWELGGTELRFPGIGWSLGLVSDGAALEGTLPEALVPHYRMPVRLTRTPGPPPAAAEIVAAREAPAPVWQSALGAPIWAGLTHDQERQLLYVASDDGRLNALRTGDGSAAWTVPLGAPIRASPTLAGGRLYVASDTSLLALDPGSGAIRWRYDFGAALSRRLASDDPNSRYDHYSAAAAVQDDVVVAPARDGCVHAVHADSGQPLWRECLGDLITATPAIADGRVHVGAFDGHAYALSLRDGSLLWRLDMHGAIPRDAVVAGDNVLFGSRSYELVAVDRATGQPDWSRYFWFSWIDSPPAVDDKNLYVGSSDLLAIQAFDSEDGRRLWSSAVPGWSWPRPVVGASSVYAGVIGNSAYFQPRAPALVALDKATGALRWMFRPPASEGLSGFASAPVLSGARIFAADLAGNVYAFDDSEER